MSSLLSRIKDIIVDESDIILDYFDFEYFSKLEEFEIEEEFELEFEF